MKKIQLQMFDSQKANFIAAINLFKAGHFGSRSNQTMNWIILNDRFRCLLEAKPSTINRLLEVGFIIKSGDRLVISNNPPVIEFI